MPLPMTVEQAAETFKVTNKSIYQWIRDEGFPVIDHKARPLLVDGAQLAAWMARRKGEKPHPWAVGGRNLFRAISLMQLQACNRILSAVLVSVHNGEIPKQKLTADQTFRLYTLLAMAQSHYVTAGQFEKDLASHFGCGNLDDVASNVFATVVKSDWPPGADDVELTDGIKPLISAEMRAMLTAAKGNQ